MMARSAVPSIETSSDSPCSASPYALRILPQSLRAIPGDSAKRDQWPLQAQRVGCCGACPRARHDATGKRQVRSASYSVSVNFRLTAATLDFHVNVVLRNFDDRWLAVADIGGDKEVGFGSTALEALEASLASLGPAAAERLLADPQLLPINHDVR